MPGESITAQPAIAEQMLDILQCVTRIADLSWPALQLLAQVDVSKSHAGSKRTLQTVPCTQANEGSTSSKFRLAMACLGNAARVCQGEVTDVVQGRQSCNS